ncbi:MAG: hypothetical protein AAFV87_04870 [Pseudomonadota bacterium]
MTERNKKKKASKDSQLVIRIKKSERDRFVSLCDELDTSAAREIRRFIRGFLDEHGDKG